jgi:hypothetical protein
MNEQSIPPSLGALWTSSPQVNAQGIHFAPHLGAPEKSAWRPRLDVPSSPAPQQPIRTAARADFPIASFNDNVRSSFFPTEHGFVTAGRTPTRVDRSNQPVAKGCSATATTPLFVATVTPFVPPRSSFESNEHSFVLKEYSFARDDCSGEPVKPTFCLKTLSCFLLSRRSNFPEPPAACLPPLKASGQMLERL